ncbi:MAG: type II secretion system F family protein [Candidatus Omnitrophica bacterium]|nr:type II secretion system F family protein [Candidatus Omnitrophota bacterium]
MPIYVYQAKRGPTQLVTGEIDARSQAEVFTKLDKMGLVPIKIEEMVGRAPKEVKAEAQEPARTEPQAGQPAAAVSIKVKSRDLDTFTRQLASLVKSGIPILQGLALLTQQTESKTLKTVVSGMAKAVKDGKMLSESMAVYPNVFNNMYLSLTRAGEKSGTLDQSLFRLADHREREQELRQRIQAALAYPILVITVGILTIYAMLTYFLPKLTAIFKGMKQQLPLPTRILMAMSDFMSRHWYLFLIALACIVVIFGRVKKGSKRKLIFDAVKLRLPFVKKFTRNAQIARFARSLAILIKNGLPIYESLALAANTLDNEALKGSIDAAGKGIVEQGLSLSESFKRTGIFPDFTLNMIAVGERSGRLVEALEDIADVYEREVDQSIKIMSSLLEPVLILTVGAVVGFIVFAMLLPVFNIGMMAR